MMMMVVARQTRGFATTAAERVRVTMHSKHVCVVTLARPGKMNALDIPMFTAIRDAARDVAKRPEVRCVVLHGEGRGFCAGLDVKSMVTTPGAVESLMAREEGEVANLAQSVGYLWRKVPAPVIAAVHGPCFGGGFQIALGCDLRLASPDAKFSVMEAKWGLVPDMGASVTFPDAMPRDLAKDLTLTGRVFDAQEALQMRLVTRLVDGDDGDGSGVLDAALKLASEVAARSPDSSTAAKRLIDAAYDEDDKDANRLLKLESKLQRRLLGGWNQLAASARGLSVPEILVPGFLNRSEKWSNEADDIVEQRLQDLLEGHSRQSVDQRRVHPPYWQAERP